MIWYHTWYQLIYTWYISYEVPTSKIVRYKIDGAIYWYSECYIMQNCSTASNAIIIAVEYRCTGYGVYSTWYPGISYDNIWNNVCHSNSGLGVSVTVPPRGNSHSFIKQAKIRQTTGKIVQPQMCQFYGVLPWKKRCACSGLFVFWKGKLGLSYTRVATHARVSCSVFKHQEEEFLF